MSSQEIKNLIDSYFDNELSKSEEVFLFSQLSKNIEAREYFKQLNILKTEMQNTIESFPIELEERILNSTASKFEIPKLFSFNFPSVLGYAFSVVLLILSLLIYTQSLEYQKDIEIKINQIDQKNRMIEMLFHSLPQAEVRTVLENEIIIKPTS